MNKDIIDYIMAEQIGKSGLYMSEMTLKICAKFRISKEEAIYQITQYIRLQTESYFDD